MLGSWSLSYRESNAKLGRSGENALSQALWDAYFSAFCNCHRAAGGAASVRSRLPEISTWIKRCAESGNSRGGSCHKEGRHATSNRGEGRFLHALPPPAIPGPPPHHHTTAPTNAPPPPPHSLGFRSLSCCSLVTGSFEFFLQFPAVDNRFCSGDRRTPLGHERKYLQMCCIVRIRVQLHHETT